MWKKTVKSLAGFCLCSLLFSALCCLPAFSEGAGQQKSAIQTLSQEIHSTLDNLKRQSEDLTLQLAIAKNELEISSKQAGELRTELDGLNFCLTNTNRKLEEYSKILSDYEAKLKTRARIIAWAAALLVLFVLVRVALAVLKIKFGISVPYWVNLFL